MALRQPPLVRVRCAVIRRARQLGRQGLPVNVDDRQCVLVVVEADLLPLGRLLRVPVDNALRVVHVAILRHTPSVLRPGRV